MKKKYFVLIQLCFIMFYSYAQDDSLQAFDIQAIVNVSAPSVKLKWELTSYNTSISVSRKLREDAAFGTPVALAANATEYTDNSVVVGKIYEYYVNGGNSREYVSVAINSPVIDYRGKVLLLVENGLNIPMSDDINRLMMDIRGDGWQVVKINVDKASSPPAVRTLIQNAYNADKTNVKAVFLLGQIAQPLSGCIAPDGHGDHVGAWATDMYYADMDGTWNDNTANCPGTWNANIPGDGKFDPSSLPTPAELQVGRVDMSNLPVFTESQTELLKRYLYKDHNFRIKLISPPRKAVIMDHFHWGFAWSGYYYFNSVFGKGNTIKSSTTNFITSNYLWGYACSAGESNGFVFESWHSSDFAKNTYNQVFTMIFGSYFGDYQMGDNFMKAALASKGWILTCSWAGRPVWEYHHMATGDNIGYSALINMNNNGTYFGSYNGAVQIDLLGDPTLRQDMIFPPVNVKSTVLANHVKITWSASLDSIQGYHIYKSKGLDSLFTRVTATAITDTFWTDPALADVKYYYQVKAYRMEKTRCGSYGNTSRGIFTSNDAAVIEYPFVINKPYVVTHIPDQTGYIKKPYYYVLPLAATFADADPGDMLVYQVYKADSTALPKGWYFTASTKAISVSPQPAKPIKFKVVVKATDMTNNFTTDTFLINIIDTSHVVIPPNLTEMPYDGSDISLFPNPASQNVTVKYYSQSDCNLILTLNDVTGRSISEEKYIAVAGENNFSYDLSRLPDGIYIITVNADNSISRNKFVIRR